MNMIKISSLALSIILGFSAPCSRAMDKNENKENKDPKNEQVLKAEKRAVKEIKSEMRPLFTAKLDELKLAKSRIWFNNNPAKNKMPRTVERGIHKAAFEEINEKYLPEIQRKALLNFKKRNGLANSTAPGGPLVTYNLDCNNSNK